MNSIRGIVNSWIYLYFYIHFCFSTERRSRNIDIQVALFPTKEFLCARKSVMPIWYTVPENKEESKAQLGLHWNKTEPSFKGLVMVYSTWVSLSYSGAWKKKIWLNKEIHQTIQISSILHSFSEYLNKCYE